jgi:crotonobetainyl-CoA:carnitine CoA-transferase CaiB-like acyl-CoA transferase
MEKQSVSQTNTEKGLLDGVTVLNLGSVGPAARAARSLADYGARVVQIAPVAKKGALQTKPVYHTYGAGRGFERMRIDLKADAGREALLRLAERADVVIESYRPGVVDRLGESQDRLLLDLRIRTGRSRLDLGWTRHQLSRDVRVPGLQ